MASEVQVISTADRTLYFIIRNLAGQVYSTVTALFGTFADASVGDYDIAMTEQGTSSGYYTGNFPALAAGVYNIVAYIRSGGSPAVSDEAVGRGIIVWDGAAEITPKSIYDVSVTGAASAASASTNAGTAATNATAAQAAAVSGQAAAEAAQTAAEEALSAIEGIDEAVVAGVFDKSVDGIRFESAVELFMAVLAGRATVSIDTGSGLTTVSYKKRNGTSNKVTVVHNATGTRTSSVITA